MSEWKNIKDEEPPKDRPFLVKEEGGYCLVQWRQYDKNFPSKFMPDFSCDCCSGYCGIKFNEWMEIPK